MDPWSGQLWSFLWHGFCDANFLKKYLRLVLLEPRIPVQLLECCKWKKEKIFLWRDRCKGLKQTLPGEENQYKDVVFFIDKMWFILSKELK